MKKLLAILLFVSAPAVAGFSGEPIPGTAMRLDDTPCSSDVVKSYVKPEFHSELRDGHADVGGTALALCWTKIDGELFIVDENGRYGTLNGAKMKKDPEI